MPRYRRYGRPAPNTCAPKPINVAAPKLNVTGLTAAYEWLAVDRTLGLRMATEWYAVNTNALLFGHPLDADRQKDYDRACKAINLGNGNSSTGERETAWTLGLKLHEKVWAGKGLPVVSDAIAAADMGAVSKRIRAVKTVLDNVNGAFTPVDVRFAPSNGVDRDYSEGTVWVPQAELEAMCAQPPLKLALTEAATVARVKSFITVDGKTEMDGALFMANLPLVLEGVYAWAAIAGGSLTKPVGKVRVANGKVRVAKAPGIILPRTKRYDSMTIRLTGKSYNSKGGRAILLGLIKDGMTVAEYKLAFSASSSAGGHTVTGELSHAVKVGLITVS